MQNSLAPLPRSPKVSSNHQLEVQNLIVEIRFREDECPQGWFLENISSNTGSLNLKTCELKKQVIFRLHTQYTLVGQVYNNSRQKEREEETGVNGP